MKIKLTLIALMLLSFLFGGGHVVLLITQSYKSEFQSIGTVFVCSLIAVICSNILEKVK